jgi:hypothetical protein
MNIEINEGNHYAEIKWLIISHTMKKSNKINNRKKLEGPVMANTNHENSW